MAAPNRKWWRGKPSKETSYDRDQIMKNVRTNREQVKANRLADREADLEKGKQALELESKLQKVEHAQAMLKAKEVQAKKPS